MSFNTEFAESLEEYGECESDGRRNPISKVRREAGGSYCLDSHLAPLSETSDLSQKNGSDIHACEGMLRLLVLENFSADIQGHLSAPSRHASSS